MYNILEILKWSPIIVLIGCSMLVLAAVIGSIVLRVIDVIVTIIIKGAIRILNTGRK